MTDPVASVIVTFVGNRHAQLARSLWLLRNQTVPVQILIADDGGLGDFPDARPRPGTEDRIINVPVHGRVHPNRALRAAYPSAVADYVILSGAEIMAPVWAVERMITNHERPRRDMPILLSLTYVMTSKLDTIDWKADLDLIAGFPGFGEFVGPSLSVPNSDRPGSTLTGVHHHLFSGAYKDEWALTDFVPDADEMQKDPDIYLPTLELAQGRVARPSGVPVYHQWHERINRVTGDVEKDDISPGEVSVMVRRIWENNARRRGMIE